MFEQFEHDGMTLESIDVIRDSFHYALDSGYHSPIHPKEIFTRIVVQVDSSAGEVMVYPAIRGEVYSPRPMVHNVGTTDMHESITEFVNRFVKD